eukprot:4751375-Pleurochrysis_carterae.AAC.1
MPECVSACAHATRFARACAAMLVLKCAHAYASTRDSALARMHSRRAIAVMRASANEVRRRAPHAVASDAQCS